MRGKEREDCKFAGTPNGGKGISDATKQIEKMK